FTSEGTFLADLEAVRAVLGASPTQINTLLISNQGDATSGVDASQAVTDSVQGLLQGKAPGRSQFSVSQVKRDTIEQGGFPIGEIFLMISSFAILAGILLIINIYVMLAEERKTELGILRAVALRRSGLVRVFVYEGYAYSLLACLVGALVGLGVAAGLVWGLNNAFNTFEDLFGRELNVPFYSRPQSLAIAASAGLLITFLTVFFTSLRISGLNIVTAIRDLPEQSPLRRSRRRLVLMLLLLVLGLALSALGFGGDNGYLMLIGPMLAALGLGLLLTRVLPARATWTAVSAAMIAYAYWANELGAVARANEDNPAMFFLEGFFIVLGAVLLVTFNLGLVFWALQQAMRLAPRLASILRMAVAYPASRRARTGFTLAMFALVLYIVTITSIWSSTQQAATQRTSDRQLSGYDALLQPGAVTPISDFDRRVAANPALRSAIADSARLRTVQVELPEYKAAKYGTPDFGPRQAQVPPNAALPEYVTFASSSFLERTQDRLEARLPQYRSDRDAWLALDRDPGLAILTSPYSGQSDFLPRPKLDPGASISLRDPAIGKVVRKRVIARLERTGGFDITAVNGVVLGERAAEDFPRLTSSTTFLVHLTQNADPVITNRELKREFARNGAQSFMVADILQRGQKFLDTFIRILQAFLAFGLIVGVAGLAVISARAVHERRRDIGTLRSVGYRRDAVGWQFLVESSLIALLGILIGICAGTLGGYNLFTFAVDDPTAQFVFPWLQMILIGLGVWAVALGFTIVPAIRASQVPPVEALRYQG
ncbi:MAG: FtsX-like permease family protein, partial [Chloroflexota bacterium]|nr:FtsX-like permease family protein [Chloroflexota bacterium]